MNEQEQFRLYGQIVAKAWSDPAFKARLQADPAATLRDQGFTVSSGMSVRVLEPTEQRIFLPLVPGAQPAGQDDLWGHLAQRAETDPRFKQRLLSNPAAVLAEEDVTLPDGIAVEVVEGSDTQGYIMVPPKPETLSGDATGDDVAGYFSCTTNRAAASACCMLSNSAPVPQPVQHSRLPSTYTTYGNLSMFLK